MRRTLAPALSRRLEQIVQAADRWQRAHATAERVAGVPQVQRQWSRFNREVARTYAAAVRTRPESPAGVLAKLIIAAHDVTLNVHDFVEEGAVESVLASAVADALALAGDGEADRESSAEIRKALALAL